MSPTQPRQPDHLAFVVMVGALVVIMGDGVVPAQAALAFDGPASKSETTSSPAQAAPRLASCPCSLAMEEAHPTREKHWMRWVQKLRAIANEAPPVPESEDPDDLA